MFRGASPAVMALVLSSCGSLVPGTHAPAQPELRTPRPAAVTFEARQCLSQLGASGARFSPVADRYYGAGCSTVGTVSLSALQGDAARFSLANLGPVGCQLAEATAAWARFGVDRAARQVLGSPLARIETIRQLLVPRRRG